jgi:predicted transcriptional regulator
MQPISQCIYNTFGKISISTFSGKKRMTTTKDEEEVQILRESLQSLFQTETRALIAWNLIIYKELTVKQLAELVNKDASTITRNLHKMQDSSLVQISRTETYRNFNVNFWKLNPEIPLHKFGDFDKIITEALIKNDFEFIKILLTTTQGILTSIFHYRIRNIEKFVGSLKGEVPGEFLSLNLMDKETGQLFRKELTEFVIKFWKENKISLLPMDKIGSDNYFSFVLVSHFPSL